jgi:uncharacterized membrane protein YfcA
MVACSESLSAPAALATVGVGLAAGFLNVTAGGGSLLAMPLLIFLGLPDTVANGTVRIAVLAQNIAAVARYHRAGRLDLELTRALLWPTVLGAGAGGFAGSAIPDTGFRAVLGAVMVAAAGLVIVGPARVMRQQGLETLRRSPRVLWPVFLMAGFYGGFVQAGVGYVLLFALTFVVGQDLVDANIMKVVLVFCYTPMALAVFFAHGKVSPWPGLLLAAGQAAGGWIAATAALKKGAGLIRAMLALAVVLVGLKLLGALDGLLP